MRTGTTTGIEVADTEFDALWAKVEGLAGAGGTVTQNVTVLASDGSLGGTGGSDGQTGETGQQGPQGPQGEPGADGVDGEAGYRKAFFSGGW
jgi:hypothetical protein